MIPERIQGPPLSWGTAGDRIRGELQERWEARCKKGLGLETVVNSHRHLLVRGEIVGANLRWHI